MALPKSVAGMRRAVEGRRARLRAEVFHQLQGVPVNYHCVYRRVEQANEFKRGWNSVSAVDIRVAVQKVQSGQANLLPETATALNRHITNEQG